VTETPDPPADEGLVVDLGDVTVEELPQDCLPVDPPDFDDCEEGS